ncbi:hypothetical protein Patl1_04357 [Pistacia atlantica]|uniref:Uncharacterized protein n=1 Tax=Pistacia atlantica TaxID=434234 RepID=A0ACC1BSK3_9ROSI|nr:hypothetical protein Patl1_04357 [Pistacia atlantica]
MGESLDRLAIRLHERLQQVHKYLLILDDVWEAIDLDCIAIPQPETNANSKIILTSCSQEVCRDMKTDEEVKLETMNDKAWQLFSRNVGEGYALSELRKSIPYMKGIEEKVYKPLKWSCDSLQAEGMLDEQRSYEGLHNRGIALIENLMDSCLLEGGARKGPVKMHDVVGDVAIWISSSMEDGYRRLPDLRIHCPQTYNLLLQGNLSLKIIPDGFLQAFQSLGILNISGARILSLPQSILQLAESPHARLKGLCLS